jgi:hypothetical protein
LLALVRRYDIDPSMLRLEITESAYSRDPDELVEIINRLRSLGFVILMDDFGSGYSSLNVLMDMPVDILKLDMRFLSKLNTNPLASSNTRQRRAHGQMAQHAHRGRGRGDDGPALLPAFHRLRPHAGLPALQAHRRGKLYPALYEERARVGGAFPRRGAGHGRPFPPVGRQRPGGLRSSAA